MRSITDWECMLLGGLTRYPELIYSFDDLDINSFSSDFTFSIYSALRESDPEDIHTYGLPKILIDVKRQRKINQDEYNFAINEFGLLPVDLTTNNIELAYQNIKNEQSKQSLVYKLTQFDFKNNNLDEIIDKLKELTTVYEDNNHNAYEVETLQDVSKRRNMIRPCGIITGIPKIDQRVKIESNTFTIIAARPFNGKTTFGCKIAMENSIKKNVLFFTTEMTKEQIYHKVRHYGMLYKYQNIQIVYKPELDINLIIRTARKHSPDLIIIDQFNKIKSAGKTEYERFTNTARRLKVVTGNLEIPIICLAQINRSAENKRPFLYNMKGSGSLEEETDVVMILHIDDIDRESNITNIYVDKNRTYNNFLCAVKTSFDPLTNFYREV